MSKERNTRVQRELEPDYTTHHRQPMGNQMNVMKYYETGIMFQQSCDNDCFLQTTAH